MITLPSHPRDLYLQHIFFPLTQPAVLENALTVLMLHSKNPKSSHPLVNLATLESNQIKPSA